MSLIHAKFRQACDFSYNSTLGLDNREQMTIQVVQAGQIDTLDRRLIERNKLPRCTTITHGCLSHCPWVYLRQS